MNIFNKISLTIFLSLAIPLSAHANWFSTIKTAIRGKKETIISTAVLGAVLSYSAFKIVDVLDFFIAIDDHYFVRGRRINQLFKEKDILKNSNTEKRERTLLEEELLSSRLKIKQLGQRRALVISSVLTATLIFVAHKTNFFGENP